MIGAAINLRHLFGCYPPVVLLPRNDDDETFKG